MLKPAQIIYDTNVSEIQLLQSQCPRYQHPHPALTGLARTLGRQAGLFFAKNRFKGLGAIELYRLQQEAKSSRELNDRGSQVSQANSHKNNPEILIITDT